MTQKINRIHFVKITNLGNFSRNSVQTPSTKKFFKTMYIPRPSCQPELRRNKPLKKQWDVYQRINFASDFHDLVEDLIELSALPKRYPIDFYFQGCKTPGGQIWLEERQSVSNVDRCVNPEKDQTPGFNIDLHFLNKNSLLRAWLKSQPCLLHSSTVKCYLHLSNC